MVGLLLLISVGQRSPTNWQLFTSQVMYFDKLTSLRKKSVQAKFSSKQAKDYLSPKISIIINNSITWAAVSELLLLRVVLQTERNGFAFLYCVWCSSTCVKAVLEETTMTDHCPGQSNSTWLIPVTRITEMSQLKEDQPPKVRKKKISVHFCSNPTVSCLTAPGPTARPHTVMS